jgi:hypothetical protein
MKSPITVSACRSNLAHVSHLSAGLAHASAQGDRVEDRESAKPGRVVHVYREIDIRDDVVVVLFDDSVDALAVPIDSVRKVVRGQS